MRHSRKPVLSDDDRHARALRNVLADKTGDDNWRLVPLNRLYQFFGKEGTKDVEAEADAVLDDSIEPEGFIEIEE